MPEIIRDLHIATTRRNIARHSNTKLADWWERQARYLASKLNTRLVELSDRPGVLVPEIFTSLY
jgi:hypothetical protein